MPLAHNRQLNESIGRFFGRTPLLLPAAFFAAGIAFRLGSPELRIAWGALAMGALAMLLAYSRESRRPRTFSSCIAAAAAGLVTASFGVATPSSDLPALTGKPQVFQGRIMDVAESDHWFTLTVRLSQCDSVTLSSPQPKCELRVHSFEKEFERGELISFVSKLTPLRRFTDVDYQIDHASRLQSQGTLLDGDCKTASSIRVVEKNNSVVNWCRGVGLAAGKAIEHSPLSDVSKMFLEAFLVGDRSRLDPAKRELFSSAGVAHLLALSGTHVGIVASLVAMAMFPLLLFGIGSWRNILVAAIIWFYVFATGSQPSVVRSATMLTAFLGARMLSRQDSSFNSLMLAAIVVLVFNPGALFDLGFQLTFAAVGGILIFGDTFNPFDRRQKTLYFMFSGLSVSVGATLGTGLISTFHFHFFPLYFLLSNVVVGLLVPLIIAGGMLFLICYCIGGYPTFLMVIINFLCSISLDFIDFTASLPGAKVGSIFYPAWAAVVYLVGLAAFKCFAITRRRRWAIASSIAIMGFLSIAFYDSQPVAASEWFINRNSDKPELLFAQNGRLEVWNNASDTINNVDLLTSRYRHYMARHGLSGPYVKAAEQRGPSKNLITAGELTIFVVDIRTRLRDLPDRANYLVIGRHTHLSHNLLAGCVNCDTIVHYGNLDSTLRHLPNIDLSATPLRRPIFSRCRKPYQAIDCFN